MTPRFLIDEQLLGALPKAIGLHNETAPDGIDAVAVGDPGTPPRETKDMDLLRWCAKANRIVVTLDRSTLPHDAETLMNAGQPTAGVLVVRRKTSLKLVLGWLELITECAIAEEYRDRIEYLT